jgi:hypothetical protein
MKHKLKNSDALYFFIVFQVSLVVANKLSNGHGFYHSLFLFFFVSLYVVYIYEIPIKDGKKLNLPYSTILIHIIKIWVLPLILGVIIGHLVPPLKY